MRLAGTYHPIPFLLEKLSEYIPSVTQMVGIWKDFDQSIYTSNSQDEIKGELKIKIQAIRSGKNKKEWSNSIDFLETSTKSSQLTLNDENHLNTLTLYFTSPIDGLLDILIFQFPDNAFLKSMNLEFRGISAQEKGILSGLLSSIFTAEYNRVFVERKLLSSIERVNRNTNDKIQKLQHDLKATEQLYTSAIRSIVEEYKSQFEIKYNKSFTIDEKVILKLAKEKLLVAEIETAIEQAINLAFHLHLTASQIKITEDYLQLEEKIESKQVKPQGIKNDRIISLLDNYENAAQQILSLGLIVNGKNVAAHLSPPVTPPAITDAVKKNKSKIAFLFRQYPEKWIQIRQHIRPLFILDQENQSLRRIS